jgi:hypothetical protein
MSGSLVTGAFVCPFFVEHDPADGRIGTSILTKVLNGPEWEGVDWMLLPPGITPMEVDGNDQVIGGGVPRYGVALVLVKATAAQINQIDAITDVWRLDGGLTDAQRNSIRAKMSERGLETDLGQTDSTEVMAGRVALVLHPNFEGFAPGWF